MRNIQILCPIEKISQSDTVQRVDHVLSQDETEAISMSEQRFEQLAFLLGNRTTKFGAWGGSYEED